MSFDKPQAADRRVRLSARQRLIWLESQLAPHLPVNIEVCYLSVKGALDSAALREAFRRLCLRHDALRARLSVGEGAEGLLELVFDEKPSASLEQEAIGPGGLRARLATLSRAPFAPGDVLVRAAVLSEGPALHHVVFVQSHLVTDGRSMVLLFGDLERLYLGVRAGEPTPELANQFLAHLSSLPAAPDGAAAEFWRARLRERPPLVRLYGQAPAPARAFVARTTRSMEPVAAALVERRTGFSPSIVLAAVTAATLRRVAGVDLVALGVPLLNRAANRMDDAGLFMEVVPNRIEVADELSFGNIARALRAEAAEVRAYRGHTVTATQSGHEIMLDYYPWPAPDSFAGFAGRVTFTTALELQDAVVPAPGALGSGNGLMIRVFSASDGRPHEVAFDFDAGRWPDRALYERFAAHFMAMLDAFVDDHEQPIGAVPLLTEAERHHLLVKWNQTAVDYPRDKCVHQLFEAQVERTPDAVALVFEGTRVTYRELNLRTNQLARYLHKLGVGPETLVGICTERSLEMVVGLLGILKAGGAYVPLDPEYPQDRLAFMLEDADVPVLLTQGRLAKGIPEHKARVIQLDADWPVIAGENGENLESAETASNLAYVIYTSGSTGRPKGVMNEHVAIVNRLLWMQDVYQIGPTDVVLQKTPFSFDVSVWEFFWPLMTGACLVLAVPGGHRNSAYLADLIAREKVTTLHFVPSMLNVFLQEKGLESSCASLKRVICSGEALSIELQDRFFFRLSAELHNLYGPTEAAVDVSYWACQRDSDLRTVPIGRPIANIQMYILDPRLEPVPVGVAGELHIGGICLARGYLNRPELTAEKFVRDPFSQAPEARLYKTGDLARYRSDGAIEYLGRLDFQIKLRGYRIELGEIELVLKLHLGVRDAVVIVREDVPGDGRLVAYVIPDEKQGATLRRLLRMKQNRELEGFSQYELPNGQLILHKN